jgi:xylulokinase
LDAIWQTTVRLLARVAAQVSESQGKVDALSLSSFCSCSIFMDRSGNALSPGIMYLDHRSAKEAEWIRDAFGSEKQFAITKNRIETGMSSVTSLLWFKRSCPELFDQVYKWGHLSTYILHKLTGEFVLDWTQASFTGIFDIANYEWSRELYEEIGINERILPDIVAPEAVVGRMHRGDIPPLHGVPVIAGAADTACSTLALGIKPGELFESVGTSDVLTICVDRQDRFDDRLLNRCHITRNQWLSHGAMSTPGASIQWFYKHFLADQGKMAEALGTASVTSAVGANGVFFLPYMQGERSPVWDIHAKGVFLGLDLNTSKADLMQAVYEGCSFGLRQIYDIIDRMHGLGDAPVASVGGGAKNLAWAQIKADVLNKPIVIEEISETAAQGACLLAAAYCGYFASVGEAVKSVKVNRVVTVTPRKSHAAKYDQLYGLFVDIYPALQSFFRKSAHLAGQ